VKVRCVDNFGCSHYTKGKIYNVFKLYNGERGFEPANAIEDDCGRAIFLVCAEYYCKFEEVKGEEMKLREGMKLRCVKEGSNLHYDFAEDFKEGEVYEVIPGRYANEPCIGDSGWYQKAISEAINEYGWVFEEVKEMFGKKDLESGMVVETKRGLQGMIVGNAIIYKDQGWDSLDSIGELGSLDHNGGLDFVKVYKPKKRTAIYVFLSRRQFDLEHFELVWESEDEEKTQALEELAKAEEALRKAREKVERMK
jgi:hypothetical protein